MTISLDALDITDLAHLFGCEEFHNRTDVPELGTKIFWGTSRARGWGIPRVQPVPL